MSLLLLNRFVLNNKNQILYSSIKYCQRCNKINNNLNINRIYYSLNTTQFKCTNKSKILTNLNHIFKRHNATTNNKLDKSVKLNKSHVKRLLSLAKPEKWKLIVAVGFLLVSSTVSMAIPFSIGKVLDIIYSSVSDLPSAREKLNKVCMLLCSVFVIGGACNFGRIYLMSIAGQRMTQNLRKSVFSAIMKQEAGWFDKMSTGQLVNRLSADAQLVGSTLSSNISDGLRSLFMVSAGAGMMFYMSWELAVVGLSVVPPVAGLAIIYGRFVRKITSQVQDGLADATQVAEERISNIRTVKTFSRELVEVDKYGNRIDKVLTLAYKEAMARGIFYGMTGLTGNMIIISVLYYGGSMVAQETITVGNLTSFLLYAAYIGISISGLSSFYSELNKGIGAAERLWDILDRKPALPITGGFQASESPNGEIVFDNVRFFYPSRPTKPILDNINLILEPGKSIAVVGGSGSGKTTLALLLLRLYEPTEGCVKLDGRDIKEYDPMWLRRNIGTVSQEPVLFSGTIRENILYGLDTPPEDEEKTFLEACRMARVDQFVDSLPQGYDTEVGERGIALSGGQRQRVAIARAIIKNPSIIILDEATSALDPQSEYFVREALKSVSKNRTVLTIAHRLSTIQAADTIAVLQNGVIAERGTYKELLSIPEGIFKELVRHQAFQDEDSNS